MLWPASIERGYKRSLTNIVTRIHNLVVTRLVSQLPSIYEKAQARRPTADHMRADDYGDEIARIMSLIRSRVIGEMSAAKIDELTAQVAKAVADQNRSEIGRVFKSVLGVDLFGAEPWLNQEVRGFVQTNTSLITSIPEQYLTRVESTVYEGARRGTSWQEIAGDLEDTYGVTQSRAELIARDQIGKFNGQLTELRQSEAGVSQYIWRTANDDRVREEHAARDGQTFDWSDPPDDGHPGEAINCFPGSTAIGGLQDIRRIYRRLYPAELALVITDGNSSIQATPNHPVLTDSGWKALKDVEIGDYLIETERDGGLGFEKNIEYADPTIEQIFNLASLIAPTLATKGVATQFHGDGSAKEVEVVLLESSLPDMLDAGEVKGICERILAITDVMTRMLPLSRQSQLDSMAKGLGFAPDSVMGRTSQLLAFLGGHHSHTDKISLATGAWFYAALQEPTPNGVAVDAILLGERKLTDPGEVFGNEVLLSNIFAVVCRSIDRSSRIDAPGAEEFAEVVRAASFSHGDLAQAHPIVKKPRRVIHKSISEQAFGAHVYNLETGSGWYVAQGLAVHNCRCYAEPVLDDLAAGDDEVLS